MAGFSVAALTAKSGKNEKKLSKQQKEMLKKYKVASPYEDKEANKKPSPSVKKSADDKKVVPATDETASREETVAKKESSSPSNVLKNQENTVSESAEKEVNTSIEKESVKEVNIPSPGVLEGSISPFKDSSAIEDSSSLESSEKANISSELSVEQADTVSTSVDEIKDAAISNVEAEEDSALSKPVLSPETKIPSNDATEAVNAEMEPVKEAESNVTADVAVEEVVVPSNPISEGDANVNVNTSIIAEESIPPVKPVVDNSIISSNKFAEEVLSSNETEKSSEVVSESSSSAIQNESLEFVSQNEDHLAVKEDSTYIPENGTDNMDETVANSKSENTDFSRVSSIPSGEFSLDSKENSLTQINPHEDSLKSNTQSTDISSEIDEEDDDDDGYTYGEADPEQFVYYHRKDIRLKLHTGEKRRQLLESIRTSGIHEPILVRQAANGKLEIIAGHNRQDIARELGIKVPYFLIPNVNDEYADQICVDTNLLNRQHSEMLPSELSNMLAVKRKMFTLERLSDEFHIANTTMKSFLKLQDLLPELLYEWVDTKKIGMTAGYAIACADREHQHDLLDYLNNNGIKSISVKQGKEITNRGKLPWDKDFLDNVFGRVTDYRNQKPQTKVSMSYKELGKYLDVEELQDPKRALYNMLGLKKKAENILASNNLEYSEDIIIDALESYLYRNKHN